MMSERITLIEIFMLLIYVIICDVWIEFVLVIKWLTVEEPDIQLLETINLLSLTLHNFFCNLILRVN